MHSFDYAQGRFATLLHFDDSRCTAQRVYFPFCLPFM